VLGIFELLNYVFLYFLCNEVGVIVHNSVSCSYLCALAFLRDPLVCMIGHLGGPISCGVAIEEVSCVIVSPIPCSPCVGVVSFFPSCTYFFGALPFFCCTRFWLGFEFLATMLSPAGVFNTPASTSLPIGTSL
jgi:hypothetical protein